MLMRMADDPDLDELERRHGAELDPDYDDDDYDDLPPTFPIAEFKDGHAVPDLDAIPQDEWIVALRSCPGRIRLRAVGTLRTHAERVAAEWVLMQLSAEARMRREHALDASAPPPVPDITRDVVRRRRTRQVSFRMSTDEFGELDQVALAYGVSASRLARMLTIRGTKRALGES
jgi:hypothetical protein